MLAILSCLPFLLVLTLFVIGRPSWQNGVVTLAVTCLLALAAFHAAVPTLWQALLSGSFTAAITLVIILPAFLLYHIEEKNGGIRLLTEALMRGCPEQDLLVLLFVLSISPLLEAICGFGIGIIVSVPLFLALAISPQRSALLGLFGEMTSSYASMGIAIELEAAETGLNVNFLGTHTALLLLPLTLAGALGALVLSGGKTALRRWWWVALLAASTLVAGEWVFSSVAGAEVTGVLSSLLTGSVIGGVIVMQRRRSARVEQRSAWQRRDWQVILGPCIVLVGSQVGIHLLAPVRAWAASHAVFSFHTQHFALFLNSGIWLFLAFLCAIALSKEGISTLPFAWQRTRKKMQPIALTILAFVVTASVMQAAGMIGALSSLLDPLGELYLWIAPLVGMLGGWITGSNIGSNAMFSPLQIAMAHRTGLSLEWLGAVQNASAPLGRMIAPSCLILASVSASVKEKGVSRWAIPFALLALSGLLLMLAIIVINTWAIVAWGLLFGIGAVVFLQFLLSLQHGQAPLVGLVVPGVAHTQGEISRRNGGELLSYRSSPGYRRRDLHPESRTRHLQQVFCSTRLERPGDQPLVALMTTRSACAQALPLVERALHAGAIPLLVSGEAITFAQMIPEEVFQHFFEQEIWPLLHFFALHRIQGICYVRGSARYNRNESRPLTEEGDGLFTTMTLLAGVLGLPFCSLGQKLPVLYERTDALSEDALRLEEDQKMRHLVRACATTSAPAIETLREYREELYTWLRRQQIQLARQIKNRTEPEQGGAIRPNRTKAALLERKRRQQIRFTLSH